MDAICKSCSENVLCVQVQLLDGTERKDAIDVRLRSALKVLLRAFGLKSVAMPEELPARGA